MYESDGKSVRSAIRDPRSAIRDPRSAIRDPRSAIRDPRSAKREALAALLTLCLAGAATAAEEPAGDIAGGVVAEVWPFEKPAGESAQRVFELWRAQVPPAGRVTLPLAEGLSIPAREHPSMVRVRGLLTPPKTCKYAFLIDGARERKSAQPDEAEMWLLDPRSGDWRLVQRTGNPNKRSGRIGLEAGVPVRFEFYTAGSREVRVSWNSQERDPADGRPVVDLPLAVVPAAAMGPRPVMPDDGDGDGLADA
jgi:hypothetical protein